jgi:uncharacterized repeat protein (TIGR03803 family)
MKFRTQFVFLVVVCVGLVRASSARAQTTLTLLASFGGTNGSELWSGLVQGTDGAFYGTTMSGGNNRTDTPFGSPPGYGTVFKLTSTGVLTVLAPFQGTNGMIPTAGLVEAPDGNFYGTTWYGGMSNMGTVFQVKTNGEIMALVSFVGTNGAAPRGALVVGADGSLYGTTRYGGASFTDPRANHGSGSAGEGSAFKVTTNGVFTLLYSFTPDTLGKQPMSAFVRGMDDNFYSVTGIGGVGWGTVFRMTAEGVVTYVCSLTAATGGAIYAGIMQGSDGNLYGVSAGGGPNGAGGVYKVTMNGSATLVVGFTNSLNYNWAGLVEGADGNFYSVRGGGGTYGAGTLIRVGPDGTYAELFSFDNTNGAGPRSALVQARDGDFYGTASFGGTNGAPGYASGTAFRLHIPNADSPRIRSATRSGEVITVTWGSLAGRTYQLQSKSAVSGGTWDESGVPVIATNTLTSAVDSDLSDPQRFYRVMMRP